MKLVTIGDSYTYVQELVNREQDAWPVLVAKALDCELVNLAVPGASNDYIFRTAIDNADEFMIVAWSECTRTEFFDKGRVRQIASWQQDPWFNELYAHRLDEQHCLIKTLSYIVALQKLDRCFQCSTFSNGGMFLKYANNHQVQHWTNKIDKNKYIGYPDSQMTRWAGDAPVGPGNHPLELGHRRIAAELLKHVRV